MRMQSKAIACLALAALMLGAWAPAAAALDRDEAEALLFEANRFFDEGNALTAEDADAAQAAYEKAIMRYERIIEEGDVHNGRLYYNLANAYFMVEDLGRAILNYRRAAQYIPNDPNLQRNLDYARRQRMDRFEESDQGRALRTIFFWHYDVPMGARSVLLVVLLGAAWAAASARLFVPRGALTGAALVFGAAGLMFLGSVVVESWRLANDQSGVVLAESVDARTGNAESYEQAFDQPLHAGTEFRLIETRGDWRYIALPGGRTCWIPSSAAALVRTEAE